MKYSYEPENICSYLIEFDIEDGAVKNTVFHGGCSGNSLGISSLVEGMPADRVVACLKGIDCDGKGTSCPDKLATAIELALEDKLK